MSIISSLFALIGRILLSAIFIISGIGKMTDISGTAAYMATAGLPTNLAWPVAIFELVAGLAILLGIFARLAALLLAIFCLLAALMFHNDFADPMQAAHFWKNVGLAGGFFSLFAYGTLAHSFDAWRARRRTVVVEREPGTTPVEPDRRPWSWRWRNRRV
ncbi:DoxX family protein [Sphingomonas cavernae]|uniref:DoxX family protein n=1 Tax=Sphingomonas cavernae TaxID=2320861 RepID=A0A418WLS6_9SPHN|nr:DoxX family protein [Sphingomonas cavernae]